MPEVRIDPLSGEKVIVAGERSTRPGAGQPFVAPAPIERDSDPFAEGCEHRTPPEVFALRPEGSEPDSAGWSVRVVPNLYPAFTRPSEPEDGQAGTAQASVTNTRQRSEGKASSGTGDGEAQPLGSVMLEPQLQGGDGPPSAAEMFVTMPASGAHEVIVNSPEPVFSLAELSVEQVTAAMMTWRERMRFHAPFAFCLQLIVNERAEGGASLPHTHAQLYVMSFVPADIARERERFGAHANRTMGQNLLGDLIQEEVRLRKRIIAIDKEAVLIAPFASKLPYQMMLAPRKPVPRFEDEGPLGASLLHDGLSRLARHLGESPPLNLWVRTAPRGADHFCWRIDVMPRLTHLAGLELSTGLALNTVPPERAAKLLREA